MIEFSPDWDARWCYLVVLGCGVLSARVQVYGRLEVLRGKTVYAWSLLSTWGVFSIYLGIPLVLFWLLDRTGALRDTSLFGAILVGLAYPAVLSGGTSLKPAAGLAGIVGWLNEAADRLAARTTAYVAVAERLFSRAVVEHAAANPPAYAQLERMALDYAEQPGSVTGELQAAQNAAEKAQIAYDYATSSAHGLKPLSGMVEGWGLQGAPSPYTLARRWRFAYGAGVAVLAVLVAALAFGEAGDLRFRVWRLAKPGLSEADLHRTYQALQRSLNAEENRTQQVRQALADALMRPGLELRRADLILSLLLGHRGACGEPRFAAVCAVLTDGIRASSVDVRARLHHALLLLADECQAASNKAGQETQALEALRAWQPLATESPIDLERQWQAWRRWWDAAWETVAARSGEPGA